MTESCRKRYSYPLDILFVFALRLSSYLFESAEHLYWIALENHVARCENHVACCENHVACCENHIASVKITSLAVKITSSTENHLPLKITSSTENHSQVPPHLFQWPSAHELTDHVDLNVFVCFSHFCDPKKRKGSPNFLLFSSSGFSASIDWFPVVVNNQLGKHVIMATINYVERFLILYHILGVSIEPDLFRTCWYVADLWLEPSARILWHFSRWMSLASDASRIYRSSHGTRSVSPALPLSLSLNHYLLSLILSCNFTPIYVSFSTTTLTHGADRVHTQLMANKMNKPDSHLVLAHW